MADPNLIEAINEVTYILSIQTGIIIGIFIVIVHYAIKIYDKM